MNGRRGLVLGVILFKDNIDEDPYAPLYYDLDIMNGGVGDVLVENFEWDRFKSNLNVEEKGFSFYYARHVYSDRDHIDIQAGKSPGSRLIGGVIPGDPDFMVVVQIRVVSSGRVRIISAFYSDNQKYLSKYYVNQAANRQKDTFVLSSYGRAKLREVKKKFPPTDRDEW